MPRSRPQPHIADARSPAARALPEEERSLDPTDWRAYRQVAHETLDSALDFLETARSRPVWRPIAPEVKHAFDAPLPLAPVSAADVVREIGDKVMPYTCGNWHPRFFGWVHGSGTPGGILAEMLAAAMNANVGGRDHSAVYVERQVIDWCRQIFSMPATASGLLVSGTSMATLIALTVARNRAVARLETGVARDVRKAGLQDGLPRLVAYASSEAHGSVAKAIELLGLGRDNLRAVATDGDFRMDPAVLKSMIAADRASGHVPFCIVATAGTVNSGAIDPLETIADVCADQSIWMHVDGAFGSLAVLSEALKPRLNGIERADSLAFDFHKWLHVPYDAGCVLIRDGESHLATFSQRPPYLAGVERGLAAGDPWFCEMGPELSRGFRALKVWFALKEHGLTELGRQIEKNCRQARYLAERVIETPFLEMLAPVSLNIACLRAVLPGVGEPELDRINSEIVIELQERGIAAPSTTRIHGKLAIRVNITNHRTCREDLDLLLGAIIEAALDHHHRAIERQTAADSASDSRLEGRVGYECENALLTAILARPEIAPLAEGMTFELAPRLEAPFVVENARRIEMRPDCLVHELAGAVLVRHALEIRLWLKHAGDDCGPEWKAAIAVIGARAAAQYMALFAKAERETTQASLPPSLRIAYERVGGPSGGAEMREFLQPGGKLLTTLLALQAQDAGHVRAILSSTNVKVAASNLVLSLGELGHPAESLLTSGGDTRVTPLADTGRNAYGASPRPVRGEIGFSSSTASSISAGAFAAVEKMRENLIAKAVANSLAPAFAKEMARLRRRISRITGASEVDGSALILTASGTDTELLALHFALAAAPASRAQPLVSIVLDPNETGSGVPLAAGGRHFLGQTAQGASVETGAQVRGFESGCVTVRTVALRNSDGSLRPASGVDAEVASLVSAARAAGSRCLLHVLDASKTGIGAPSLASVLDLAARHRGHLDVIVDACQMRLGADAMQAYLERGFMLQITGSKFFTGPPFAGALVLPRAIANRSRRSMPAGLLDYTGGHEWPGAVARANGLATRRRNVGLLMRWTAALHEIDAYRRVPGDAAHALLERFSREARAIIESRPDVRLHAGDPFDRGVLGIDDPWSKLNTILSFAVHARGADGVDRALPMDDLRLVHRLMAEDIFDRLPADARCDERVGRSRCLIGQPVKIGESNGVAQGVLRLCSSSRLVSDAAGALKGRRTRDKQAAIDRHLAGLIEEARVAIDKACLIAKFLPALKA